MSAPLMRSKKSFAQRSKATSRMGYREQREVVTMSSPETCWPVPMRAIGAQNLLTMPGGVSAAVFIQTPATLPICEKLATRVVLNSPVHSALNVGGTQSLGPSSHHSKPSVPLLQPAHSRSSSQTLSQTGPAPLTLKPPVLPVFKHGVHVKPAIPKFPPPLPPTKPATSFQRASPDGRSFRSTAEENLPETRKKRVSSKHGTGDESDDDYENVQLPDSVFIDSTETSCVERLFRESAASPQNGLYGIRNSGTKTAKVLVVWDAGINKARNYRLFEENDSIFLENNLAFPNLSALIEHYYLHPLPHHDSLCLQQPYTKVLSS
uniref:SH3-domain binding protein 2 n=2 Tax=Nothobranchius kadleci TaxID=1051664 RepID=A0A1A8BQV6_NOTKA